MAKQTLKAKIRKHTIKAMTALNVYKPEFEPLIDIYCEMREQYELYTAKLKTAGYKCDEATAAGGTKKSALVSTLETLRKDILIYSDRLYLNPKSLAEAKKAPEQKESALEKALRQICVND